jgi:prolyl-tRNA synthetase
LKSLLYFAVHGEKHTPVLVVLLGDDQLNELKLKNHLNADKIVLAKDEDLKNLNLIKGVLGPKGINHVNVVFDKSVNLELSYVIGANKKGFHLKGYIPGSNQTSVELRLAQEGDLDSFGKPVTLKRGIEVGHIFQLGKKYTESMGVMILGPDGKTMNPLMGCYGIGVTRVIGAAIEQSHDEKGIIWPLSIAPFQVHFVSIWKNKEFLNTCNEIYEELNAAGIDTIFDDRDAGPGFKFKDADLLGCPIILACGERDYASNGKLQITLRKTGEKFDIDRANVITKLNEFLGK